MIESECRFDLKEESLFFLGILRDHSEFMFLAFPSSEKADVRQTRHYMDVFADLGKRVANRFSEKLLQEVKDQVEAFLRYQQGLLNRQLACSVSFNLPPLILEETIAEAREFLLILDQLVPKKNAVLQNMHEHLFWLWNFTAHTDAIGLLLDPVEETVLTRAREFKKLFMALFYKAYAYQEMIRPQPEVRSNLLYLTRQAAAAAKEFVDYLAVLQKDVEKCAVLGILPALLVDHFIREAGYYIGKISVDCLENPVSRPRINRNCDFPLPKPPPGQLGVESPPGNAATSPVRLTPSGR